MTLRLFRKATIEIRNRSIPTMKNIALKTFLLGLGLSLIPTVVRAQSQDGCYAVGENGQRIELGSLCGEPTNSVNSTTSNFQVPIKRRDGGTPVVNVVFNGNQTFEMLLDTGASNTAITPAMANALRLKPVGVTVVNTASETGVTFPLGIVNSMRVGNVAVQNVPVAVSPALDIGLLGQDVYGSYDVTIREKFVEFRPR